MTVEVYCECGERLADAVTEDDVRVDGDAIPFRRTTDFVMCDGCGALHRVTELRERSAPPERG